MRSPALVLSLSLSLAIAALTGCARDDVPANEAPLTATAPPTPPVAPPVLSREPRLPLPGPARKRLAAAVVENEGCELCHDEIAREWRGSFHQRSNLDPAYQKAFAVEPSSFCRGCHAPEADPLHEPPGTVSALGVGCVTCHVTEAGVVLAAAHPDDPLDPTRPSAPHPLRRSADFARAGACAGCHEFRFPMPGGDDDAFFMQTTAREHRRSPAAARACADCHMPLREGHRSHAFAEVRDEAWLRAGLRVTAERAPDDTLRLTLTQTRPGHAFPTGDLFRRLEVGYALLRDDGTIERRALRHLARHFERIPGLPGRHLTRDDRVEGDPSVVVLELPSASEIPKIKSIFWWVSLQRVATIGAGASPAETIVESEVKLSSGVLPWSPQPPPVNEP
ncbi:MAG: multiheme c-type cytochrome [Minicystis sp.]